MPNKRIQYLLELYFDNALTDDEHAELSQLLDETNQHDLILTLANTIESYPPAENSLINEHEITDKVNQILAIDKNLLPNSIHHTSIISMIKYGAVAAIAILIGAYWIFKQDLKPKPIQETAIKKDVAPGKNGAVLVLSDGTQVTLDSALDSKVIVNRNGAKIQISKGQVVYLDSKNAREEDINSIQTPAGRKYNITLSDGTKVWLNASSSIAYPVAFSKNARKVTISGQVYFEVTKNPRKPFIVNIKNSHTNIEVLGTHFDINTYADKGSYKTTLLEGSIKLHTSQRNYLLTPNQQAISNPNSENVQIIDDIDPEDIMAWKDNLFSFNSAGIDEVMLELSRWYDITVKYEGNKPQGTFTGKIQKDLTLRQTLKILGATRVKYELTQDKQLIITN